MIFGSNMVGPASTFVIPMRDVKHMGAQWLNVRVLELRLRGCRF